MPGQAKDTVLVGYYYCRESEFQNKPRFTYHDSDSTHELCRQHTSCPRPRQWDPSSLVDRSLSSHSRLWPCHPYLPSAGAQAWSGVLRTVSGRHGPVFSCLLDRYIDMESCCATSCLDIARWNSRQLYVATLLDVGGHLGHCAVRLSHDA